jgi:putative acetyltransferase
MTVTIRAQRPADRDAVRRVVAAAFGDDGLHVVELLGALDGAGRTRVDLVAEVDDAVVGHVRLSQSWVDAREALIEVLVLSPLAVAPSAQGGGVGTALLAAAVEAARAAGVPAVFLEGSPDFYGARGWERGSAHGFTRPSTRIPDPAFQVVVFEAREPWMTGPLVYCDPFWALDAVGLRDPLLERIEHTFER